MLMADVMTVTLLLLGLVIVLPATWLLFGALWPSAVGRAQARIPARPWSTFFAGTGVAVVATLLVGLFSGMGVPVLALLAAGLGLGWSFLGLSALARHVGGRLSSPADPAWKAHLRGGIVLALSFLVPILGWLFIFPISLLLGAGAATCGLFRRAAAAPAPAPVPEPLPTPVKEEVLA